MYCLYCRENIADDALYCKKCGRDQGGTAHIPPICDPVEAFRQTKPTIVGKTCPYCQMPIKPGVSTKTCPLCKISHHSECWGANGEKCTTFGCKGTTGAIAYNVDVNSEISPIVLDLAREQRLTTNEYYQNRSNSSKIFTPKIVVRIFSVIAVIGILVFGLSYVTSNQDSQGKTQTTQIEAKQAVRKMEQFVVLKNNYDQRISDVAVRFNQRLNTSNGKFADRQLLMESQEIMKLILQTKMDLSKEKFPVSFNQPVYLLNDLLEHEITRISAIYQGLLATEKGGDYLVALKPGTDAAYKFDDANEAFSRSYSAVLKQVR